MQKITIIALLTVSVINAQKTYEVFPDDLNVQPFTANFLEPKLGFLFNTNNKSLRLDVGNSLDVFRKHLNENEVIAVGADLFTYSRLRSEKDFKFPVETIDYLFGLNFTYKKTTEQLEYGARFRLSHISAHLVDGRYNKSNSEWIDNQPPFVFSKEFLELMPYIKYLGVRVYAGIAYNYHIEPKILGSGNYQIGFDYFYADFLEKFSPFIGYDFRYTDITKYEPIHSFSVGIKTGKMKGKGLSIYLNYYSGKSIHGEFFNHNVSNSSIGFNLDL